jgi:hypothetical protein
MRSPASPAADAKTGKETVRRDYQALRRLH